MEASGRCVVVKVGHNSSTIAVVESDGEDSSRYWEWMVETMKETIIELVAD